MGEFNAEYVMTTGFWIKFGILFAVFSAVIWFFDFMEGGVLWKLLFTLCAAVGIFLALSGKLRLNPKLRRRE